MGNFKMVYPKSEMLKSQHVGFFWEPYLLQINRKLIGCEVSFLYIQELHLKPKHWQKNPHPQLFLQNHLRSFATQTKTLQAFIRTTPIMALDRARGCCGGTSRAGAALSPSALKANTTCVPPATDRDASNTSSKGWIFPFYLMHMWYLQLLPEEQRMREGEWSGAVCLPCSVKLIHI